MSGKDPHVAYLVKNLDSGQEWHVSDLWQVRELQEVDTFQRVSAHISGASLRSLPGRRTHVCYELEVLVPGKRPYSLSKRYRDFAELNQRLIPLGSGVKKTMASAGVLFPPKVWLGNLRSEVVLFRQRALNLYLNQLLREIDLEHCEVLQNFLAPPPRVLRRIATSETVDTAARPRIPTSTPPGNAEAEPAQFLEVINKQRHALLKLQQENLDLRRYLAKTETQVQQLDFVLQQMEKNSEKGETVSS